MKKLINIIPLLFAAAAMTGCNNWLDMSPTDKVSDKIVWSEEEYIKQYVNGFYPYISRYGAFETDDAQVGNTEGLTETLKYGSMVSGVNTGFANHVVYALTAQEASSAAWHFSTWSNTYGRIRRVNEFLYSLSQYGTWLDEAAYNRYRAEARFFRGYLYWQMMKRTDQIILYDEDLLAITPNKPLSTADEGWDMVEQDLTYAAQTLPASWSGSERGRVTSGAAWALLSRAMLYAERWQSAKNAAEEVLKLNYELMPGTTAAEYEKAFTSALDGNTESILEYNYLVGGPNHGYDKVFMPKIDGSPYGAKATPTQELVESYEKAGGGVVDWTPWHTTEGTTEMPPYADLEPRFHASVLYDGVEWKGRTIEPFVGGFDGWVQFNAEPDLNQRTTTGYLLRKLLDENYNVNFQSTQPWVAIRLAEVILNHAEAAYRLNDATAANADVRRIRARVGLPYADKSGEELFKAIRQERKLELFMEGHLWWDMRRWRLAHTEYTGMRVHGLKITNEGGGVHRYQYVNCDSQDRIFNQKLYRIPLPEDELNSNASVQQFSEWL